MKWGSCGGGLKFSASNFSCNGGGVSWLVSSSFSSANIDFSSNILCKALSCTSTLYMKSRFFLRLRWEFTFLLCSIGSSELRESGGVSVGYIKCDNYIGF